MPELKRFSVDCDRHEIGDALLESGAVIVEGLFSTDQLATLNREIDPLLEAADPEIRHLNPLLDEFFGKRVRHVTGLAGKSALFAEQVMCNPLYLTLCDRVLRVGDARGAFAIVARLGDAPDTSVLTGAVTALAGDERA